VKFFVQIKGGRMAKEKTLNEQRRELLVNVRVAI